MQPRSPSIQECPVGRAVETVGEWWSILILRDAFQGATKFDEFYHDWYGRKYFVIPIVFLGAVAAVESYFIAQALQELIGADRTSKDFSVAVAAMAGAYGYVCWDLIGRMRTAGHPHILGSECDVLHVPEASETIRRKVEAMLAA